MYDITALGELLIDFTEYGVSADGQKLFEQNPGGAVVNVLAAAQNFGRNTAFIGKVGLDMHGLFLKTTLECAGIHTAGMTMAEDVFTTLAFVALSPAGERTFSFARKPGADTCLTIGEVDHAIIKNTRILHVGSLSLTNEPARAATYHAVKIAKAAGAIISYDPNYRASLWPDRDIACEQIRAMLNHVDVVKLSDEEAELLTGFSDPVAAVLSLYDMGIQLAVITLGEEGALICARGSVAKAQGYSVPVVDTTGAGDAFWGAFLHKLLSNNVALDNIAMEDALSFAQWGNATAALCIGKRGAIPAMPSMRAVEEFMCLQ